MKKGSHGVRARIHRRSVALAGAASLVISLGCSGDFHLSAHSFSVSPNPAVAGQEVAASFILNLVPGQRHTMVVYIDDEEHLRLTADGLPDNPILIPYGDAADLIDEYGAGDHTTFVLIEARGERTRTQIILFRLNEQ